MFSQTQKEVNVKCGVSSLSSHWTKIRTLNGIKRIFREIKKRLSLIGVFSNQASCERTIVYSVFIV